MRMKHLNLLLFASSMMFVAPAYGQDYKQVWADEKAIRKPTPP